LPSSALPGFRIGAPVEIFVGLVQEGPPNPLEIVLPQAVAAVMAVSLVVNLWGFQKRFR
jgi:hypothetical protein